SFAATAWRPPESEAPRKRRPEGRLFSSAPVACLLDLAFLVDHVLAHHRVELLHLKLLGHGALVLGRGVEMPRAGAGDHADLVSHGNAPRISFTGRFRP